MQPETKCPRLTVTTQPDAAIIDFTLSADDEAAIAAAQAITVSDADYVPQCEKTEPLSVTSRDIRSLGVMIASCQRDLRSLSARLEEIAGLTDQLEDVRQAALRRQRCQRRLADIEARAIRVRGRAK